MMRAGWVRGALRASLVSLALAGPLAAQTPVGAAEGFGAVLRASERAVLSAGLDALVTRVAVREGDAFAAGDTLVELDCTLARAAHVRSVARHEYASLDHDSNEQLATLDSVSDLQLAESRLRLAEAQADLAGSDHAVSQCKLLAPFDGVLTQRSVEPFEQVNAGRELMQIVSNRSLDVEFLAPSEALASLRTGGGYTLHLDEHARSVPGHIVAIVPSVDAVSRTVKVVGRLDAATHDDTDPALLWAGMSGWVELDD